MGGAVRYVALASDGSEMTTERRGLLPTSPSTEGDNS